MADSIQLVSIFIGSPSGLEEERRTAKGIVEELNRDHSRHWGCILELVGWEETLPGHGRPQELINKDLDRCEYFIGILYDHWGSQTAAGNSKYSSGFEEEFDRAKSHLEAGNMKDMAVYFKELPAERKRDPGPSLTRVIEFREACFARKDALYADFSNIASFESLVRAKLNSIGWMEYEKRVAKQAPIEHAERPKKQDDTSRANNDETTRLLSPSTEAFFVELLQRSSKWEDTSAADVARLRLIGSSLYRSGNDDDVLGNHDANILFLDREKIDFSTDEMHALFLCGIEGFGQQNVPLWHWLLLRSSVDEDQHLLRITAASGRENQQANAIRLLTLLNLDPPELGDYLNRENTLKAWLEEDAKPGVLKSAIEYLREHGRPSDNSLLEEYYQTSTSQKKSEIGQAIISIETKEGEAHALNKALELGVDEVDDELGEQLFRKPASLKTELLTRCLHAAASTIRLRAISILNERKETDPSIADGLLSDPDYGVRYFAAEALHMAGRTLGDDVVEKALTMVKKARPFSVFTPPERDKQYFDHYRLNRFSEMDFQELRELVDQCDVFDEIEATALFQQHTRKVQKDLRSHLEDGFASYFEYRLTKMRSLLGGEHATVVETNKLIPFLQRRMLRAATEALAKLNQKQDLGLLRNVIDRFQADVTDPLLSFLGKFGDWSDIKRIDGLGEYSPRKVSLLTVVTPPAVPQKASAMVSIARERIADLLTTDFSVYQRRAIIQKFQKNDVGNLSDEVILEALNHEDDECRAILALKCCEHLPKKRLKVLLDRYTQHDQHRYYNSIHWLDMGVSMPRDVARLVCRRELSSRI